MSKIIFAGLESAGKSLKLAMVAVDLAYRNAKWLKISGKARPICSNLKFSDEFYDHVTKELGVPIYYWTQIDELVKYENADIIIDEVGNYFDSRLWQDLSLDVRKWLTQGAKTGIEIYGSAQDFAQVDKSFRRLVNDLLEIKKVIGSRRPSPTKPPVTRIWGLCMVRSLDPRGYNEDKKKFDSGQVFPEFFLIQERYCKIFDTTQKIGRGGYPRLRHEERFCEDPKCNFHKVIHV